MTTRTYGVFMSKALGGSGARIGGITVEDNESQKIIGGTGSYSDLPNATTKTFDDFARNCIDSMGFRSIREED